MIYVTVVNRTTKDLEALWDGVRYYLKPGENALPETIARIAKRQNPRMGTDDPYVADMCESLIGIKEHGDDCSPIEQSASIERLNRSQLPRERQKADIDRGINGLYGRQAVASEQPFEDSNFVDPSR